VKTGGKTLARAIWDQRQQGGKNVRVPAGMLQGEGEGEKNVASGRWFRKLESVAVEEKKNGGGD